MDQSETVIQFVCGVDVYKKFWKKPKTRKKPPVCIKAVIPQLLPQATGSKAIVPRIKSCGIEQFHCLASWSCKSNTRSLRSGLWMHLIQENACWVLKTQGLKLPKNFGIDPSLIVEHCDDLSLFEDCSIKRLLFEILKLFSTSHQLHFISAYVLGYLPYITN